MRYLSRAEVLIAQYAEAAAASAPIVCDLGHVGCEDHCHSVAYHSADCWCGQTEATCWEETGYPAEYWAAADEPRVDETRTVTRWCDCVVSYVQPADVMAPVHTLTVHSMCGWYHATTAQALRDLERAVSSVTDGRVRAVPIEAFQ